LIGVRAAQFVLKQLDLEPVQVTLWSDSKCVLHWIRNHSRLQPTFTQNRVEDIRNANFSFRYIPSDCNPVDIATRGLFLSKLGNYQQWWKGPKWLAGDQCDWPLREFNFKENDEEVNVIAKALKSTIARGSLRLLDASRFSKWTKLIRTTIWILKFINSITKERILWLQSLSKKKGDFTAEDYRVAVMLLIKEAQTGGITEEEINK
ncbi:unnamed protein product, partial [Onchocerca ochengi]